ncbi:MAG: hypothetical protein ACJ8GN_14770 [Longimicrobiaceae bacterium]
MKKLRLEDIQVDSYATGPVSQEQGTVQANMATTLCQTATIRCQQTYNYPSCVSSPWCC